MPSKALQELRASLQARQEVEARDTASRTATSALLVKRERRPPVDVALGEAGGDDPDHAGMPTVTREDQAGASRSSPRLPPRGLGRGVDLALGIATFAVGAVSSAAISGGAGVVFGQEQLDAGVRPVKAARRR